MNIEVGDWIRIYHNSVLEIVEVRYVRHNRAGTLIISTDYGEISTHSVLEIRRLAEFIRGDES